MNDLKCMVITYPRGTHTPVYSQSEEILKQIENALSVYRRIEESKSAISFACRNLNEAMASLIMFEEECGK